MKKKKVIIGIVSLLIIGGLVWYFLGKTTNHKIIYDTVKVSRSNINQSITATGTVEPVTQVEVGTQVSGIVNKLYVDYNSEVKKGQVIAELDKTNLLNELASKRSTMANAKTQYDYQLRNYTRLKTLFDKKLIADTEYETALYNYETAKNSYDISRNDVAKAETDLGYATIYSPIDGVVLSRAVEEGQTVAASFSTPTLFTIANDLTAMQVVADVDEADIGDVAEGQRVSFTVDAFPNDVFDGTVTQVRQQATTTSNVVTYEVVISAYNPDLKLKPGLTANTTIFTLEKNNIITVPTKALRFTPVESLVSSNTEIVDVQAPQKVWIHDGNRFIAQAVETGISNGVLTEIISGIDEGTSIVSDMKVGETATPATNGNRQTESSPFMPQRPGGNRNR
ncbi:MAG: efflux RND transporter periplasmic adaptor subunit [Bacteroides sp.]|nr:efflux RND transporter periplasmic adaptor subunit [Bacteroides sp.]